MQINEELVKQIVSAVIKQVENEKQQEPQARKSTSMAGRERINEQKTDYSSYPKAKQGTDPKEVVIGVGAAFQKEIKKTITGIPLEDVLRNVKAGIEEEGMKPRVVKILDTSDVCFMALEAAKLSGSGIGVGEVTGSDFVTEGLTDLSNTEGHLLSCCSCNVLEVYKNTLCCFGTKVNCVGAFFCYTDECLEHEVELTDACEVHRSAVRATDTVFLDVSAHFIVRPTCRVNVEAVLESIVFDELVSSVTALTYLTVHKRVRESAKVTGCNPCLGIHDDSRVKTYVVGALCYELLPPCLLNVVLEFNAERTVVPRVGKTAVDFGACVDKASVLTKSNYLIHCFCFISHSHDCLPSFIDR